MRILLTGAGGQVGHELARALAPLGQVDARDRAGLDLADAGALVRACRSLRPALIVNAAAYTAVDRAESDAQAARLVNARAPGILAGEAKRLGAVLVHFSTDYVFDGSARTPYREDDPIGPLNEYGRSKLEGERAVAASGCRHLVFRTSWVYGPRGRNFLLTMLALAAIPRDGVASGIYHLSAAGETTWAGFAQAIFARAAASRAGFRAPRVVPIATADYPTPARRPAYSVLSHGKFERAFGFAPDPWEAQLDECFRHLAAA